MTINSNTAGLTTGVRTDSVTTDATQTTTTNPNSMTLQEHIQHISNAISTTSDNVNQANIDSIFSTYYTPNSSGVYTPITNKISNGKTTKEIPKILFASNNTIQLSSAEIDANVTGINNEQYTMKLNFEAAPSTFVENLQGTTEIESGLNNNPPAITTNGINDFNINNNNNCITITAERNQAIADKDQAIADKDQAIADKDQAISEKNQVITQRDQAIADKDQAIADKNQAISEKEIAIAEKNQCISNIENLNNTIADKEAKIQQLQEELAAASKDNSSNKAIDIKVQAPDNNNFNVSGNDRNGDVSGNNRTITVLVGDTLTFNLSYGNEQHPFHIRDRPDGPDVSTPAAINNGSRGGSTVSWIPNTPGTYYYQCASHPDMLGNIVVTSGGVLV